MITKEIITENTVDTAGTGYYPLLFILSLLWIAYYNPFTNAGEVLSFTAQQLIIFTVFQAVDLRSRRRGMRFALAGAGALYIFLLHLNAFLLSITSMTLYESVMVLAIGGDFLYTLEEAGLSTGFITLLVLIIIMISCAGASAYNYMPSINTGRKKLFTACCAAAVICLQFFIFEQYSSRDDEKLFSRRTLPLYFEIFSTSKNSMTFSASGPARPDPGSFSGINLAGNPENVLVILLESFRKDSVNPVLSPAMAALSNSSSFTCGGRYYTGAIYTSLAWNTILMDRPPFTLSRDIAFDREHEWGSPVFRIFMEAGYETYIASSANLEWKNFRARINGKDRLIHSYFCGYRERTEERNLIDRRTRDRAVEWIKASGRKPFFMLVQLDSTHWTYYSDESSRRYTPFAGKDVNIAKLRNPGDIELLFNRYRNAVIQVHSDIALILNALKEKEISGSTAVVIVSDHGEGFAPGMIGHSVLHNDIMQPAFIIYLPGSRSGLIRDGFISHMDIFPTLFDYLKIGGTEKLLSGRSMLDTAAAKDCMLTFHGSLMMAELTLKDYSVYFMVKQSGGSITFTPAGFKDSEGRTIPAPDGRWKDKLREIMEQMYGRD